jgi:hypothetical protein
MKALSLIQIPALESSSNLDFSLLELNIKVTQTTPKEQISYLIETHKKLKLIHQNLNLSLTQLYNSYLDSASSCKNRLQDYTNKRNEMQETFYKNKLEIESLQSILD